MHRVADVAKMIGLYSSAPDAERHETLKNLDTEVVRTMKNIMDTYNLTGKATMQRAKNSKNLAATTKNMRDIAREAHRRGLNRQMTPAQFKLLDPKGTHIIAPKFFHDRADGKLVEMHCRCHIYLKLIGKQPAVELMMDVPMSFIEHHLTGQEKLELMDLALEYDAVENLDGKPTKREEALIELDKIKQGNEATPNADKLSAEGKS